MHERVESDKFVEFRSEAGHLLILPSQWTAEEDEHRWYLNSPDKKALISVHTYLNQKVASLEHLQGSVVKAMTKNGSIEVAPAEWERIEVEEFKGWRRVLVPTAPSAPRAWRAYLTQDDQASYVLIVYASPDVMALNSPFYEGLVATFKAADLAR